MLLKNEKAMRGEEEPEKGERRADTARKPI
jgi:hypothetical protein